MAYSKYIDKRPFFGWQLEHTLYLDGNVEKNSWVIQTNESVISQTRIQTENYKDKITKTQSKYVALHVALFWGIRTFNIKNKDSIKIKLDEKITYQQLKIQISIQDEFLKNKIYSKFHKTKKTKSGIWTNKFTK